jgi:nucleoside 2-deoxyribosyltransferase
MNRLSGLRCYLAGPIDHADDDGVGWRTDLRKPLEKMGCTVFDPCDKPIKYAAYKEIEDEKLKMMELKETGRYFELSQRMKEIVHVDLRMVDVADFLVVYMDLKSRPFGTVHELINSLSQRKPTLVVIEGGKGEAPNWLFGIMDFNFMFDSFDDLEVFLRQVDDGTVMGDLSRWVFFEE